MQPTLTAVDRAARATSLCLELAHGALNEPTVARQLVSALRLRGPLCAAAPFDALRAPPSRPWLSHVVVADAWAPQPERPAADGAGAPAAPRGVLLMPGVGTVVCQWLANAGSAQAADRHADSLCALLATASACHMPFAAEDARAGAAASSEEDDVDWRAACAAFRSLLNVLVLVVARGTYSAIELADLVAALPAVLAPLLPLAAPAAAPLACWASLQILPGRRRPAAVAKGDAAADAIMDATLPAVVSAVAAAVAPHRGAVVVLTESLCTAAALPAPVRGEPPLVHAKRRRCAAQMVVCVVQRAGDMAPLRTLAGVLRDAPLDAVDGSAVARMVRGCAA